MPIGEEFTKGLEIIKDRFYFVCLRRPEYAKHSSLAATNISYSIDNDLVYEPFYADFGPLNLGQTYRFCEKTLQLLEVAERQKRRLFFYTAGSDQLKANAAVLIGFFQIVFLNRNADDIVRALNVYEPFPAFRDASCFPPTFDLRIRHCLRGIEKARDVGFIDWGSDTSQFSIKEYESHETVEGGDLNWVIPTKLLAFAGPSTKREENYGYRAHIPEDYIDYFKGKGVSAIVRLNKKMYEKRRFTCKGFHHYDLYFPDGSCPSVSIIMEFLKICDSEPGAVAVHCKAGLGRTGVLICCYMMRTYRFTAEQALGYIRICRPGSVIGPQQNFLKDMERKMWEEGNTMQFARNQLAAALSLGRSTSQDLQRLKASNSLKRYHYAGLPNTAVLRGGWMGSESSSSITRSLSRKKSMNEAAELSRALSGGAALSGYGPFTKAFVRSVSGCGDTVSTPLAQSKSMTRSISTGSTVGIDQPRVTHSSSGAMLIKSTSSTSNRGHTSSGMISSVRGVAPNGQPRKGPALGKSLSAGRSQSLKITGSNNPQEDEPKTELAAGQLGGFKPQWK